MRVLIACEFSGTVRAAFEKQGHYAISCDLLPSEIPGNHYQCDIREILHSEEWDLMIAHPPCTHLAVSGARWFPEKKEQQKEALSFVRELMEAPIDRICIENPVSIISTEIRKPDQVIQPWQFGHGETKATCLWLKNLPLLQSTNIVTPEFIIGKDGKRYSPTHYCSQWRNGEERWKIRSRTFQGIAEAMAAQWGNLRVKQLSLF